MDNVDNKSLSKVPGRYKIDIILNLYVLTSFDFKKKQIDKIYQL